MINFDKIFPDEREKGETTLRQCQLVMLRILKILDFLCRKHEIDYFLTGGTLLGCIRHQGFIPWDDDIDIGMTRANYEKFLKYAVSELPKDVFFQTAQTDKHYHRTSGVDARLRDKYSSFNPEKKRGTHEGLMVDIFVYDCAFFPSNLWIVLLNSFLNGCLQSSLRRAKVLKWIANNVPFPMVYCSNFVQNFSDRNRGTYVKPEELAQLRRFKFEDMEALIPSGYDSYLRRQFGDYMVLPPEGKRVSHHKVNPDPFTPCEHPEVLFWKDRNSESV